MRIEWIVSILYTRVWYIYSTYGLDTFVSFPYTSRKLFTQSFLLIKSNFSNTKAICFRIETLINPHTYAPTRSPVCKPAAFRTWFGACSCVRACASIKHIRLIYLPVELNFNHPYTIQCYRFRNDSRHNFSVDVVRCDPTFHRIILCDKAFPFFRYKIEPPQHYCRIKIVCVHQLTVRQCEFGCVIYRYLLAVP